MSGGVSVLPAGEGNARLSRQSRILAPKFALEKRLRSLPDTQQGPALHLPKKRSDQFWYTTASL
jgi:hypothetical protein